MSTIVLNSSCEIALLRYYFGQVQLFLYDLTCDYPFFGDWLKKALEEVSLSKRQIIVMNDDLSGRLIGLAIVKTDTEEKKICTIRVDKDYQRQGYGTILIKKSVALLGTDKPLITVSEKHIDIFKPFFSHFGFKVVNKVKSLYHLGEYEYFFNVPYIHRTVLLSIKPEYTNKILSGEKTVEFRKKCFSEDIRRVYIYSSSPVRKIVGCFDVKKLEIDSPEIIWDKYNTEGAVSKAAFYAYAGGSLKMTAIKIENVSTLKKNLTLGEIDGLSEIAPQNYCLIDNVIVLRQLEELQCN